MIRQFRRKLTGTALLTLTVMLALMVGAINLVNALTVRAQICSSLEMLVTGGGQGSMIRQADGETETVPRPGNERQRVCRRFAPRPWRKLQATAPFA